MSHLLRAHAPITEAGWQDIDEEARARVTPGLAARRTVDFRGPHGWEKSAVSLGRVGDRDSENGVEIATRLVQPMAEARDPSRAFGESAHGEHSVVRRIYAHAQYAHT